MSFTDNVIWLLQTVFSLYLIILWLRILLPGTHTSSHNPVSQWVMKLTNVLVLPLQRILPRVGRIDYVTLLVLFILQVIELYIVGYLQTDEMLNFFAICVWAFGQSLNLLLAIFVWSIILEVIFSWLSIIRRRYYAIQDVLQHLTNPVLKPIQSIIPHVGRFDFSPLIALLLLSAIEGYIVGPIIEHTIIWAFNSSIGAA